MQPNLTVYTPIRNTGRVAGSTRRNHGQETPKIDNTPSPLGLGISSYTSKPHPYEKCFCIQTVFTLATAERYLLSRMRGDPALAKLPRVVVPETEELEFVVDPIETTRLQGDLIILGKNPPLNEIAPPAKLPPSMVFPEETLFARYAFSQALSRSTALSALEVALDEYLSSMALLPHSLAKTGKPGMGRTALVKKLGELMKFRQGLNLNRENFSDVPDFYWTEPELEKYFNSVSDALDVKVRTDSVNDKITYAAEAQSVLRQLLTETSTHSMELVIIALIAVEVVIALIRDGPELWEIFTGQPVSDNKRPDPHSERV
ncbi:DUF155 domain-containing protein [Mycena venus]|uniref:DUF155 domain-containing protein n=1 Tax=Mycena venus TaxID=2733690 RepID=A0A8H7CHL6_9AGAR|nr:DUF155 domain-containing protein [Mycena venus]